MSARIYGSSDAAGGIVLPSYGTDFAVSEDPLLYGATFSEGLAQGGLWTNIQTVGGYAQGTQPSTGAFNDSIACLNKRFTPNQGAAIELYLDTVTPPQRFQECEILLRFLIGPGVARGYEMNYAYNGEYCDHVLWYQGGFTHIHTAGGVTAPVTGDVLTSQIVGNIWTTRLNGVVQNVSDISTDGSPPVVIVTGSPGLGTFRDNGSAAPNSSYRIKRFSAWCIP
jgi:hypothetical protein